MDSLLIVGHVWQVAVDYLVENLKKTLYLEKEESVPVYELLSVVAAQYNMTAEHYCEVLTAFCFWIREGGGGGGISRRSCAVSHKPDIYF